MMTLKRVSLSLNKLIFMRLLVICLGSCCINMAASHASANPNVSAPKTDLALLLDFMLEYSIIEAFWFLLK